MKENSMADWRQDSYLAGVNSEYLEALYDKFLDNPDNVPDEWRAYFAQLNGGKQITDISHQDLRQQFFYAAKLPSASNTSMPVSATTIDFSVWRLVEAYRRYGHRQAQLDPLKLHQQAPLPALDLTHYGLSNADLDTNVQHSDMGQKKLAGMIADLQKTYCGSIGFEYMHIHDEDEREWLRQRIEAPATALSAEEKKQILKGLVAADGLEKYLSRKYVGKTRFSLEGGDNLITALNTIINSSTARGVKECVLGMPHRGRVNVSVNVLGKSMNTLIDEFEGNNIRDDRAGDVIYHSGFSSNVNTAHGVAHLSMMANPSHLEMVGMVALGSVHARQFRRQDARREQVLPILMHGDGAVAGQGVVMEIFNLSLLKEYTAGGTIHIVVNNQVGFTTSLHAEARSSYYSTDVSKMIEAPVLHVNGDDAEAVYLAAKLAFDYRMRFHKDIVIELFCYRRLGHNEADEPSATQPLMYQHIRQHPVPAKIYADKLLAEKIVGDQEFDQYSDAYRELLDQGGTPVETTENSSDTAHVNRWEPYLKNTDLNVDVDTTVSLDVLKKLGKSLLTLPAQFALQRQVGKIMDERKKMFAGEQALNWGAAEALAFATLLTENYHIRLAGQDSQRGTFAHRHAVLHDQKNGETFTPLNHLSEDQQYFCCVNSPLSELSALGFEYGYAATEPDALILWEAQYGDFANGAQIIMDQFLSACEQKWDRYCGLTLLLPHGYQGAGPEHSSAHLERFLMLSAQQNMSVCNPTTPAQIFHLLRRQALYKVRKPLIVMSPKNLLRHKLVVSSLDALAKGKFEKVLPEIDDLDPAKVKRVVLCSGKVYYDLLDCRRAEQIKDIAIIRVEQLYPFPEAEISAEIKKYPQAEIVWCQEEPKNHGAWYPLAFRLQACVGSDKTVIYVGRLESAPPSSGSNKQFRQKQEAVVVDALNLKCLN
ncbi:MAG: 2-oxoglutarate dehydrogenase E1 component [Pseudomonadota bacterium]